MNIIHFRTLFIASLAMVSLNLFAAQEPNDLVLINKTGIPLYVRPVQFTSPDLIYPSGKIIFHLNTGTSKINAPQFYITVPNLDIRSAAHLGMKDEHLVLVDYPADKMPITLKLDKGELCVHCGEEEKILMNLARKQQIK